MMDLTFTLTEGRNALVVPRIVNIGKRRIGRRDRQTLMMIAVYESSERILFRRRRRPRRRSQRGHESNHFGLRIMYAMASHMV